MLFFVRIRLFATANVREKFITDRLSHTTVRAHTHTLRLPKRPIALWGGRSHFERNTAGQRISCTPAEPRQTFLCTSDVHGGGFQTGFREVDGDEVGGFEDHFCRISQHDKKISAAIDV